MPPLDFPNAPATNQTFAAPNGVIYEWDGAKWTSLAGGTAFLPLTGGTLTGPLTLAADPAAALQSATKQYTDAGDAAAQHNAGRNLLHNALFNVQQRGAGGWTANQAYTADRWVIGVNTDAINVALGALGDPSRAQIGDEAATNNLVATVTGNAAAAAFSNLSQGIEDVRRLSNKTVTVSFWATVESGTAKLGVSLDQGFGTGGSPSAPVRGAGQSVTVTTTTWARYSVSLVLPSVAGKTIGTTTPGVTWLNLWFSSGATNASQAGNVGVQTGVFHIWGVQLEIGATATPLEKLEYADDLRHCQRFYYAGFVNNGSAFGTGGSGVNILLPFPTTMRAAPTVSQTLSGGSGYNAGGTASATANAIAIQVIPTTTGAMAYYACTYTAAADL
jgi:hypothetical protein